MLIRVEGLWFDYTGIPILKDLNFTVGKDERIALVGPNGSGKTTLLKILSGDLKPSKGEIHRRKNLRIGYMEQFNVNEDMKLFDWIVSFAKLKEPHQIKEARSLLKGFGFDEKDWERNLREFSGGELRRIGMAGILLGNWDLILLDEPTNHLDILSVEMVLNLLEKIEGAVIMVTHDEYVLKRFPRRFMELNGGRLYEFKGDYESYMKQRQNLKDSLKRRYTNLLEEAERLKNMAEKYMRTGDKKLAPLGKSKLKMYERMKEELDELDLIEDPDPGIVGKIELRVERSGELVLVVEDLTKIYGDRKILNGVSFEIRRGEKVALLGKNGSGKTTLLKVIMGTVEKENGTVSFGYKVIPSYMSQENFEIPDGTDPFTLIRSKSWDMKDYEVRSYLGRFGFKGDDVFKKTEELSGGEKLRLALAINLIDEPNFLLLDEPTNHLDMWTTKILRDFLKRYEGTILMVSHDRRFVEDVCDRFLILMEGRIIEVNSIDEYLKLENLCWGSRRSSRKDEDKLEYANRKKLRNELKKMKERYNMLEREIEVIGSKRKKIEKMMESEREYIRLMELTEELEKLKKREDEMIEELADLEGRIQEIEVMMVDRNKRE